LYNAFLTLCRQTFEDNPPLITIFALAPLLFIAWACFELRRLRIFAAILKDQKTREITTITTAQPSTTQGFLVPGAFVLGFIFGLML